MSTCYLGFDIGGTKCAALVGKPAKDGFDILGRIQIPTQTENGWQDAISRLFAAGEQLLASLPNETPVAAGISCGGPLNSHTGVIQSPPNLPGWDNVPITRLVEERFGIPAYLQNDANACALAEWNFGAGKGSINFLNRCTEFVYRCSGILPGRLSQLHVPRPNLLLQLGPDCPAPLQYNRVFCQRLFLF